MGRHSIAENERDPATGRVVSRPDDVKFWERVDKNGSLPAHRPDLGRCWSWTGSTVRGGYGDFTGFGERRAHRASWVLHNGAIPIGRWVLHACDNPQCVNPTHLFLGDAAANVADMRTKGRAKGAPTGDANGMRKFKGLAAGSRNGNAKLTDAVVYSIRAARDRGEPCAGLAEQHGVAINTVTGIGTRRLWGHLPET